MERDGKRIVFPPRFQRNLQLFPIIRLFDFITVVIYWKTATDGVVFQLHTFRTCISIYISRHTEITLKSPAILVLKHSSQGSFNSAIMSY